MLRTLRERFELSETRFSERRTYYDTFDWRLHAAGATLVRSRTRDGDELCLSRAERGAPRRLRPSPVPAFVGDLPAGPLRQLLEPVVEMRRLFPQVELHHRGAELRLLDREAKTVARLRLERRTVRREGHRSRSLPPALRLLPVRGYRKASKRLRVLLEGDLGLEPSAPSELEAGLALFGRRPGDYGSKLDIPLVATMRADEAAKAIHLALLDVIEANRQGVIDDLDTEFLHDFRVAVRRTRSALTQIKGVFAQRRVARFRRGFGWLGRLTGRKRDLDVYQLKMPAYRSRLPDEVAPHLAPLEELIEEERRGEQKRLVRGLEGARYRELLASWEELLTKPVPARTSLPNARRAAIELVSERIWKVYRRLLVRGRQIGPESPAASLHRLRIEAKKLRYLLELFRTLYPDAIRQRIRALKQLQDNLGDFNDFVVQQGALEEMALELAERGRGGVETQMALGRLVDRLHDGEQEERRAFASHFARFDSRENRTAYRELVASRATAPEPGP